MTVDGVDTDSLLELCKDLKQLIELTEGASVDTRSIVRLTGEDFVFLQVFVLSKQYRISAS